MHEACPRPGFRAWHFHDWLLGSLLLFNFLMCLALMERQATGWDALGYQVAGQNIARGIGPVIEHPFNAAYGPYFTLAAFAGQRLQEPNRLYLNYPPGFPILLAIPQWLGLPDYLAMPVLSTIGVLFTYWLGCLLFGRWTGLLGAAILAFTPIYIEWGTSFWADLPGTCFMLGALAAYVVALRRTDRAGQVAWGGGAGAMAAAAVFIKYSHILVLLPVFAYAVFMQRKAMFGSTANWAFATVIVAGVAGVGLYNQALYGGPLETAYAASRYGIGFPLVSLSYALGPSPADGYSLIVAGRTLLENFGWLLIFVVIALVKASRGALILLAGLFLVFLGMSSTYAWAPQNVNSRYLLPLLAPVALYAARGCLSIHELRMPRSGSATVLVLLAVAVTSGVTLSSSWRRLEERNRAALQTLSVAQDLTGGSEPHAVFLAYLWNDLINYFGDRTTFFYRRILANESEFEATLTRVVTDLLRSGVPVFYVEDTQPPFRNSLQILQREFKVEMWKSAPLPVYRIESSPR